jgi:hypothetical protein
VTTFNDRRPKERQGRLFNPLSVPRRQVHEQTFDEFARSPRTMWHGSSEPTLDVLRTRPFVDQGFHVGTLKAAHDRRQPVQTMSKGGFLHPVRINAQMKTHSLEHDTHIGDMAELWEPRHHGYHYTNEYEDPGSTSAVLHSPHDVKGYVDHLRDADLQGKSLGGPQRATLDAYQRSRKEVSDGKRPYSTVEYPHVKMNEVELVKTDEVLKHAPRNLIAGQHLGSLSSADPDWNDKTPAPVHRYDYDVENKPRRIAVMRGPQFEQREMFEPAVEDHGPDPSDVFTRRPKPDEVAHVEMVNPAALPKDREDAYYAEHHEETLKRMRAKGYKI